MIDAVERPVVAWPVSFPSEERKQGDGVLSVLRLIPCELCLLKFFYVRGPLRLWKFNCNCEIVVAKNQLQSSFAVI